MVFAIIGAALLYPLGIKPIARTIDAGNNKIFWSLDARGDIRNWPDVKESFSIAVVPATA